MLLYSLLSSSSLQTVPCNLASGSLDQLKLFRGFAGCGTFFFGNSTLGGAGAVAEMQMEMRLDWSRGIERTTAYPLLAPCLVAVAVHRDMVAAVVATWQVPWVAVVAAPP